MQISARWPSAARPFFHWETRFIPLDNVCIGTLPRDVYVCDALGKPVRAEGRVHTQQRGLRSGIVFASADSPAPLTLMYFQDFSRLHDYFSATSVSPADCVGGQWPELGYSPPSTASAQLVKGRELTLTSAYVAIVNRAPEIDTDIAKLYVDTLADLYSAIEKPSPAYHHWPDAAKATHRDLALSPSCSYRRQNTFFMTPYVGDFTKPPESMVQLTNLMPLTEYERWSGGRSALTVDLARCLPKFYNKEADALVRWLPSEPFRKRNEALQNHHAMDSWYFYHSLFNVSRLAKAGNETAWSLFRNSLPRAMEAARRFQYRWPVFFDIQTLDVIRAEAKPGAGGENDVAGLYALVMLQAHDLFKHKQYLVEARTAADSMHDLGFSLGYQTNTTGFAAEAYLKLAEKTGEQRYRDMSVLCLANLFDNLWLWQARYGNALSYPTFFGLFPLRDSPYLAAYEELEMVAKVHDYLNIGREDVPEPVRFLLAEYVRHALDRAWFYFPANLPPDAIAEKSTNGEICRNLSVPLEDLQDGWQRSGQVGQEVYGSGLALVMVTRHFKRLRNRALLLFCEYPIFDVREQSGRCTFKTGGSRRGACKVRLIPTKYEQRSMDVRLRADRKEVRSGVSPEGHFTFELRGDQVVEVNWRTSKGRRQSGRAKS